jgi:UDP:flavonoid glycosyltransferase YjiC (YdhE family)
VARILMTWEIGHNYGHVLPLLPIARVLAAAGHTVVFALKDLRHVGARVAAEGFEVLQAPAHPDTLLSKDDRQPQTMTDILQSLGFGRAETLEPYLQAWRHLMALTRADLVVASYAPVSLLAARTLGLRTAVVGMAFELPPPQVPSPSFRPWLNTPTQTLLANDEALVDVVNQVLRLHDHRIASVFDVFAADRHLLWTFPELDPHHAARQATQTPSLVYCGAILAATVDALPRWPDAASGEARRVLGYLRCKGARLRAVVEALSTVDAAFCLVVPDLDPAELSSLVRPNVHLTDKIVNMGQALSQADAVLTYGGHGTVCASLLAGRPLVLVPEQMESVSIAHQVARLGAAAVVRTGDAAAMASACGDVLTDARYSQAAQRFQNRYQGFDTSRQAGRVARVLHELVGGRPDV